MTADSRQLQKKSIRKHRGRKLASGLNVVVSLLLALVIVGMINYLASRYYARWNISWDGYYHLSDKTIGLLHGLDAEVEIVSFFRYGHELHQDVQNLLKEYQYEADKCDRLDLKILTIDPDRDLARATELAEKYEIRTSDMIVFQCGKRRKYLEAKDIDDYKVVVSGSRQDKKRAGFKGEQAFSSAIQTITESASPAVYFLTGHAERQIDDYSQNAGYSKLARIMRSDNIDVKKLHLGGQTGVPTDCAALIIAGPDRAISQAEVDYIREYLDKSGRVLMLLDPLTVTGLEKLLRNWGVRLARDIVVDPRHTLTGRELVVTQYGDHALTRVLKNVGTTFYMPRSIESLLPPTASAAADRPRVVALASSSESGWGEANLNKSPARFDQDVDRRGPISVAVAVERGPVTGIDVELAPTRMVVIGDSDFVSNGGLREGGGGNEDFLMSSLNWLLERESIMAIAAKEPGELRLDLNRDQRRLLFLAVVLVAPAVISLLGAFVWLLRRK